MLRCTASKADCDEKVRLSKQNDWRRSKCWLRRHLQNRLVAVSVSKNEKKARAGWSGA
jgi:hypothetical protein